MSPCLELCSLRDSLGHCQARLEGLSDLLFFLLTSFSILHILAGFLLSYFFSLFFLFVMALVVHAFPEQ